MRRAVRRRGRSQGYGPIGHMTDGGLDVRAMSDARLRVEKSRAWNASNMHDLLVVDRELRRRGLMGVWP